MPTENIEFRKNTAMCEYCGDCGCLCKDEKPFDCKFYPFDLKIIGDRIYLISWYKSNCLRNIKNPIVRAVKNKIFLVRNLPRAKELVQTFPAGVIRYSATQSKNNYEVCGQVSVKIH
ncbi:MAG: hypothetical protein LBL75_01815 [Rickettsiales bacterium]|nr:hypothetical protein [Rickettsiales bacterium]